jgi:UDP-glucose 4-epimerase
MLVTGGAGFIGTHLVKILIDQGDQVRVLDDLSSGSEDNLAGLDVDLIVGDIRDQDAVQRAVAGVDYVFHLAAMISPVESMKDPLRCYDINVNGTLNVLWKAYLAEVKQVVLASSCAVYGDASNVASMVSRVYGLPTINLRYFNVYGPGQMADSPYAAAIPIFIATMHSRKSPTVFGDGHQTRDFVYVSDVVRANLLAAKLKQPSGDVYNVAGPTSVSVLQLIDGLREIIPDGGDAIFAPPRPGDILHSRADRSKAEVALGYRPEIALEQGLQRTVQWYESEGKE